MLLWLFIAAIIMPYILAFVRSGFTPLNRFSLSDAELKTWIREIDPAAGISGGGGSSGGTDSESSDYEYLVALKNATQENVFSHIEKRCREQITKGGWEITRVQSHNESFSFVFSNAFSRYRLYVWNVPLTQDERDRADEFGEQAIRIKVLTIGYTSR